MLQGFLRPGKGLFWNGLKSHIYTGILLLKFNLVEGEIWSIPICACDRLSASSTRDLGVIMQIKYLHHIEVLFVSSCNFM